MLRKIFKIHFQIRTSFCFVRKWKYCLLFYHTEKADIHIIFNDQKPLKVRNYSFKTWTLLYLRKKCLALSSSSSKPHYCEWNNKTRLFSMTTCWAHFSEWLSQTLPQVTIARPTAKSKVISKYCINQPEIILLGSHIAIMK